jgi:hypothetical protein
MPKITKKKTIYKLLFTTTEIAIAKQLKVSREYIRQVKSEVLQFKEFLNNLNKTTNTKITEEHYKKIRFFFDEGILKIVSVTKNKVYTIRFSAIGKAIIPSLMERLCDKNLKKSMFL